MTHVLSILLGMLIGAAVVVNHTSHLTMPEKHINELTCETHDHDDTLQALSDELQDACALQMYGYRRLL